MATKWVKGRKKRTNGPKKSHLGLWTILILVTLLGAYMLLINMNRPHVSGDKLRFDQFIQDVKDLRMRDARILDQDSFIVGTYVPDQVPKPGEATGPGAPGGPTGPIREYNAPLIKGTQADLLGILLGTKIPITIDQQVKKQVINFAALLLPGLALIVLFGYLILSSRRGTGLFAIRSGARKVEVDKETGVTFGDVAGHDSAIVELREVTEFLSDPERFTAVGAQVPKGILLYGPPGCGKTMLARALANESGASFYSISGSDFVEVYVGVGASRVRDLFREARDNSPALIFIDELDSVGRARGGSHSHGEQEQALNQILAEMDGFSTSEGIIVIGATNRPDVLDQALLRPGRFDRSIGLALPDEPARLAILEVHASTRSFDDTVDLAAIAHKAVGLTGADLASVINEGALRAARAGRSSVTHDDLERAVKQILAAPERQRRLSLRNKGIGRRFTDEDRVTFADLAGVDDAIAELAEIRDFLVKPDRYKALGAQVPKGVLLYGPPGCGKTMMARALAGESNAAFFSVGASEFVNSLVGKGAAQVREVFADARSMAPSIIFIDELDAVGRARGMVGVTPSHGEQEQTLNQILAEMDGFSTSDGLIVIGATNRPDVLDQALLRPGRFDRSIGLALPDEAARLSILKVHAKDKVLGADVDLVSLAHRGIGLTGADLSSVLNEGALLAARAERAAIRQGDLDEALKRIMEAPERQRRLSLRSRSIGQRFGDGERVTFADVAGADDAVSELAEIKDFLTQPERFAKMGAKVPRGVLMSGPPGCGKTLLARALAGEANAAFFSVSASEFVEVFVGEGAARVRDMFAQARSMAPAIVFIDEIDAIGSHRGTGYGGNHEREQTLNQILVELDGFAGTSPLIVIAATNRADILDPALIRPGRFDRHVTVRPPDRAGRLAILQLYTSDKSLAPDVDLAVIAGLTQGFSGADLANLINEAALLAVRRGDDTISMTVVDEAIDRSVLGIASRGTLMSDEERSMVAYHEAGHAIVGLVLPGAAAPHRLTITPRGGTLGHCMASDSHDKVVHSRSALLDSMAAGLAGRVAEQLVFGEIGSGAGTDLERANNLALVMVCELGMSEALGALAYNNGRRILSDAAGQAIDAEVRGLLDDASARAREVLTTYRTVLDRAAELLLENESVPAARLTELLDAVPNPVEPASRS